MPLDVLDKNRSFLFFPKVMDAGSSTGPNLIDHGPTRALFGTSGYQLWLEIYEHPSSPSNTHPSTIGQEKGQPHLIKSHKAALALFFGFSK